MAKEAKNIPDGMIEVTFIRDGNKVKVGETSIVSEQRAKDLESAGWIKPIKK